MPYATAQDGINLYYDTFGVGDPMLLVSGQRGYHHVWDEVRGDFVDRSMALLWAVGSANG